MSIVNCYQCYKQELIQSIEDQRINRYTYELKCPNFVTYRQTYSQSDIWIDRFFDDLWSLNYRK